MIHLGKAPVGYVNIRRIDDKGREERTVELDEERAPLVKMAFEEYATGKWTISMLAQHLASCGLTTRATPKVPSCPISRSALNKVLNNPFYKGTVCYKGMEYKGNHSPITNDETWNKVQDILRSHLNGERTREHPHFLKGSVFCRNCGSRMIVSYAKSHTGVRYPYFVCSGRHSKRTKCECKAILISEVELGVELAYERHSLKPEIRSILEEVVSKDILKSQKQFEVEQAGLTREKGKLERKRKKLLEAHYDDAIPLELFKSEQTQISKELTIIEHRLKAHDIQTEMVIANLKKALDLIENCGRTYKLADEHIKRIFNQALLGAIWIEMDGNITTELAEPFKSMIQPFQDDIVKYNIEKAKNLPQAANLIEKIQNHIQYFFGCGLNKVHVVGMEGLEPTTSSM